MSRLRRIAGLRLCSEGRAARVAQGLCFAAAPFILYCAAVALRRFATTPGEVVVGLLAAGAACLLCVVLGLLLPLSVARGPAGPRG